VHNDGVAANQIDRGDRITGVNGRAISSIAVLEEFAKDSVFEKSDVTLNVLKPNGAKITVKILAGDPAYRATVGDFVEEIGAYLRDSENGLLVTYVGTGSLAERADLVGGDRIIEVNGTPIAHVGEFVRALEKRVSQSYEFKVASADPHVPNKVESRLVTLSLPKGEVKVETKEPEEALGKRKKEPGRALGKRKVKTKAAKEAKIESKPAPRAEKLKKTPKRTVSKPPAKKKSRAAVTDAPPPVQFSAPRRGGGGGGSLVLP
jgi:C-terminal processing protease CtpA/Prc